MIKQRMARDKTLVQVADLEFSDVQQSRYDLALFASGIERRAPYIARRLDRGSVESASVLGFSGLSSHNQRRLNDRYFNRNWVSELVSADTSDDSVIPSVLNRVCGTRRGELRLLVDYSCMPRTWYASLLLWSRLGGVAERVTIDFVYASSYYRRNEPPIVIDDIYAVPGCEGRTMGPGEGVAIFGLGFYGLAALCVLDRLEADRVYAYIASPGARKTYEKNVRKYNKALLEDDRTENVLGLPLDSVETAYRYLAEVVGFHRSADHVTFVPMGPKPHVLVAVLLSMRFWEVTCLKVKSERLRPVAKPTGKIVSTRVEFQ